MTDWREFHRILCRHCPGYGARINPRIVSDFDDAHTDEMARRLYMVPLPVGHPIGLTELAEEFIATGDAA